MALKDLGREVFTDLEAEVARLLSEGSVRVLEYDKHEYDKHASC